MKQYLKGGWVLLILLLFTMPSQAEKSYYKDIKENLPQNRKQHLQKKGNKNKFKLRLKQPKEDKKKFPVWELASIGSSLVGFLFFFIQIANPTLLFFWIFAGIFSLAGLILAIMALKKEEPNKTLAYIGVMVSVIGLIGTLFMFISINS